jgi:hypothetical protein
MHFAPLGAKPPCRQDRRRRMTRRVSHPSRRSSERATGGRGSSVPVAGAIDLWASQPASGPTATSQEAGRYGTARRCHRRFSGRSQARQCRTSSSRESWRLPDSRTARRCASAEGERFGGSTGLAKATSSSSSPDFRAQCAPRHIRAACRSYPWHSGRGHAGGGKQRPP